MVMMMMMMMMEKALVAYPHSLTHSHSRAGFLITFPHPRGELPLHGEGSFQRSPVAAAADQREEERERRRERRREERKREDDKERKVAAVAKDGDARRKISQKKGE